MVDIVGIILEYLYWYYFFRVEVVLREEVSFWQWFNGLVFILVNDDLDFDLVVYFRFM